MNQNLIDGSAKPSTGVASAARTASGNSRTTPVNVSGFDSFAAFLNVTAVSGTTPTLDVFAQASNDGGTTWFDVPYDQQLTTNAAAADQTAGTNKRNISGAASITAAAKTVAVFRNAGYGLVSFFWVIGGTTPSFTFDVVVEGR